MANKYLEIKEINDKEFDEFAKNYAFFAFSQKQFNEGMKSIGLSPKDTDKVYNAYGMYYKKSDAHILHEITGRAKHREVDAIEADTTGLGYIKDMFYYELNNHEYGYTGDLQETLDCLGFTMEDIEKQENLKAGLIAAKTEILQDNDR